ncbi:MAG TPA: hypothetical protein VGP93_08095 [Polyangiaceae bacterium]|nr:hypothetical protein [Polyangiaceae bacterium]
MRTLRARLLPTLLLAMSSCLAVPPASERATDAARELNLAARFGRMDVALSNTAGAARKNFLARRAQWGHSIRVVDVELAAMSMADSDHAEIQVDYSWTRMDEGLLHTTRISQNWEDSGNGWKLVREKRLVGDLGLFGEPIASPAGEPHPDVQFATKVIE